LISYLISFRASELQKKATYHPSAAYTPEIISHLISYATSRGIRILPEFDTPGHTAAVGQAYPELIADCYEWLTTHYNSDLRWSMWDNVALDVTKQETKNFVEDVMGEMAGLFPDQYFHVRQVQTSNLLIYVDWRR
jgi:hexosaminidase